MEPKIYEFQSMKIVGVGNIGTPVNPGDVWSILFSKIEEIPYRKHPIETLGIIKRNEQGYLAGAEVAQVIEIPEGMCLYEVPAGNYIGMTHRGPLNKINETFEKLIDWLFSNNYEQHDIVCFEVYDDRFKGDDIESEFELYVQIKNRYEG